MRSSFWTRACATAAALLLGAWAEGCGSDGVVGGGCADGFTDCDNVCVDLNEDPLNCGACGNECSPGLACVTGVCGQLVSAGQGGSNAGGAAGSSGASGSAALGGNGGMSGSSGQSGSAGNQSAGGSAGHAGKAGSAGQAGNAGHAGQAGQSGQAGASGVSGSAGANGGSAGASAGNSGASGASGQTNAGNGGVAGSAGNAGNAGSSNAGTAGQSSAGNAGAGGDMGAGGVAGAGGDMGAGGSAGAGGDVGTGGVAGAGGDSGAAGDTSAGGTAGMGGTSGASGQAGAAGMAPTCLLPKIVCNGICLDPQSDPLNCGDCGNVCPTGVCSGSQCRGTESGNQVLLGIDFAWVGDASMTTAKDDTGRVLANTAYLNSPRPDGSWKVLGFDPSASPTADKVDSVITTLAASHGVSALHITRSTTAADALSKLTTSSFDAFLAYDEPTAPSGSLAIAGAALADTLTNFAGNGGDVVVLTGGTGTNEMWSFAASAQVMAVTGFTLIPIPPIPAPALHNNVPADGVGQGISNIFAAATNTGFWTLAPDATIVDVISVQSSGDPVVLHRTVSQ